MVPSAASDPVVSPRPAGSATMSVRHPARRPRHPSGRRTAWWGRCWNAPARKPPARHPSPRQSPARWPPAGSTPAGRRRPAAPVIVLPPGGGGRLPPVGPPPGGGGLPPRGPGFGPAAAGAAAVFGAPALISAARAAPEPRDVPGLPDPNERRYLPDEVLFVLAPNAPAPTLRNVVRRFNLTLIAEERFDLVGATVHRYRIPNRTTVPAAVRAMSAVRGVGYVQPNYCSSGRTMSSACRAPPPPRAAAPACNMSSSSSACPRPISSPAARRCRSR